MKNSWSNRCLIVFATVFITLLVGCGDDSKAPEPPLAAGELMIRLFNSLNDDDFLLSAEQSKMLEVALGDNTFLSQLERVQETNYYVLRANEALKKDDLTGAEKIMREGINKFPENDRLRAMLVCVNDMKQLNQMISLASRSRNSAELKTLVQRIRDFTEQNSLGTTLEPSLKEYDKIALLMERNEYERTVFGLKADMQDMVYSEDGVDSLIAGQLEYEKNFSK